MGKNTKQKNREAELRFAKGVGESKLGMLRAARGREGTPKMGIMTKNDHFKRFVRGAEPERDPRVSGSGIVPGKGAFPVYYEKPGGRRGGKGRRI